MKNVQVCLFHYKIWLKCHKNVGHFLMVPFVELNFKIIFKFLDPISIGRASITYSSPNDFNLSFKIKDKITVLSKPATETNDDVWYVEINGKHGYAPKTFIVEEKVIVSGTKLITVSSVTGGAEPIPSPPEPVLNVETNTDSQNAQIINDSSEAKVSNVNEVQDKDNPERSKRSTGEQDLTNNIIEKIVENSDAPKTDEVKIEDLNKYDSKNFDENSTGDEDGDEEEEDDDEYDDAENSLEDEEEESNTDKKPVVEEPVVKKTAYVTTDAKVETSVGSGNDDKQPKLEIMAPTQAEIEKLKHEQELKSSSQITNESNPSANSSAGLENAVTMQARSTVMSSQEPVSSEQEFTTTVPLDVPQSPLDIPVEVTTPLPNALKVEDVKNFSADSVTENTTPNDDLILKNESIPTAEPSTAEPAISKTEEIVLNDEVPPFKPLPESVDSSVNHLHSTEPVTNIVTDTPVASEENDQHHHHDHHHPSVTKEHVTTLGDNSVVTSEGANIIAADQPIIKDNSQPAEVVQEMKIDVTNDSLPNAEETTEITSNTSTPDADIVVDTGVNTFDLENDSNKVISDSSEAVIPENLTEAPLEQIALNNNVPIEDILTQSVGEGVGVAEIIQQSPKIEEQHQADADNNLNSESIEVENKSGIIDTIINSVRNLFGGSSTVESLVEVETSPENFDKALNDILFSQAVTPTNDNVNKGMFKVANFQPVSC